MPTLRLHEVAPSFITSTAPLGFGAFAGEVRCECGWECHWWSPRHRINADADAIWLEHEEFECPYGEGL